MSGDGSIQWLERTLREEIRRLRDRIDELEAALWEAERKRVEGE